MGYIRKKFFAFTLILFTALIMFYGCNDDKYKNMKLEVNQNNIEIVLNERPENNLFSITAQVSNLPKGYDGAVTFSVPINDFISVVNGNPTVKDGKSIGVFEAKQQGGPVTITVKTLEGNLTEQITVRVVKPISSIKFNSSVIPVVKGERTDISKFLTFNPEGTAQNGIKLELSNPNPSDAQLIRIVTEGNFLTVPNDLNITEFKMRARSTYNNKIVSENVDVKVVSLVPVDKIVPINNNNTPNNFEDDITLEKNSSGEYNLTLATNTGNLFSKTIYFNFDNDPNLTYNYVVDVTGLKEDGSIVDNNGEINRVVSIDKTPNSQNTFTINAIGNGKSKIEFVIKHAEFPDYEPFIQKIVLNINVEAFPTKVEVTNGSDNTALNQIKLFANYDGTNLFGTPIKIVVSNETGVMNNQEVILSLNTGDDKIALFDAYKNPIPFNTPISAGNVYYLTHSFETKPAEEIILSVISDTYNEVFTNVSIVIETEEIVLSTTKNEVNIDITKPDDLTMLEINGLPTSYNYNLLKVELVKNDVSDAGALVTVTQTQAQIALSPKGAIGECYINVIAENGSQVTFKIILFESLQTENSYITVAGLKVNATDNKGGNLSTLKVSNGLNISINFTINNKNYTSLNGTGLIYNANSTSTSVVQIKPNYKIQTQNMGGSSQVTIQITGFDELGNQEKTIYFDFIVEVTVPLDKLSTTTKEVVLYDKNTLSANQIATYGTHEIILTSSPSNASLAYGDIEWICEYNGTEITVSPSVNGDEVTYTFYAGFNIVTLTTSKTNFKRATVSCEISGGSVNSLTFTIIARVQQEYKNEYGTTIKSPKTESVRFIVYKAEKVENFVFENVQTHNLNGTQYYEIVYDERDLGYDGSIYTNTENCTREISFSVYPTTALYKDLGYKINNSAVRVSINNVTKKITVQILTKIVGNEDVILTIYALDSVGADGSIGSYKEIKIRVLDGSIQSPFEVSDASDLQRINSALNANYVLINNITLSNWTPIGYINNNILQFNGTLSGKQEIKFSGQVLATSYYTISGMKIVDSDLKYQGLFAYLGANSVISDLIINNFLIKTELNDVTGNFFAGVLAGYAEGQIINVTVNDLSGVQSFNGTYYQSINTAEIPDSGIYITSQTDSSEQSYYFVGGLIGFLNNANLNTDSTVQNVEEISAKGNKNTSNNTFDELNLKTNNPNDPEESRYEQVVNANVSAQINVHAQLHNIAYVGGIAGFNNRAVITKTDSSELSFGSDSADVFVSINAHLPSDKQIFNQNSSFGGAVGFNNGVVENLEVKASIFGVYDRSDNYMSNIGGVVGHNVGTIQNTKSFPLLRGHNNIGGIVGKTESAIVTLTNTVSSNVYSFVNGKAAVDEQGFTMENSITFNSDFQILVESFESITLTYDEFVNLIATQYFTGNDADDNAKDFIRSVYDETGDNVLPDTYYIQKISKNNLLTGSSDVEYNVFRNVKMENENVSKHYYNKYTSTQIAKGLSSYGSNVVNNNSVEFLYLNDKVKLYNTAILGFNNVGGLIGEYIGLMSTSDTTQFYTFNYTGTPVTSVLNVENYNPIQFNTVYNYNNDAEKSTVDPFITLETGRGYYGNILLANSHIEEISNNNRNFAGGLVGKLTNGVLNANQVFASIQGHLSGLGGLVGKADGITQISNSSYVGVLYNRVTANSNNATSATGGLVGDALNASTTFAYYGEYENSSNNALYKYLASQIKTYTTNYSNSDFVYNSILSTFNNISHSYYQAVDLNGSYIVGENSVNDNNKSVGFVGEGRKDINITYKYYDNDGVFKIKEFDGVNYLTVNTDILKVNQETLMRSNFDGLMTDKTIEEISVIVTNNISTTELTTLKLQTKAYGVEKEVDYVDGVLIIYDSNSDGLKDSETGNDYTTSMEDFKNTHLNTYWYFNYQVNNGLPVLLSENKLELTGEKSYKVSLLANFPPTNLFAENKQNYVDTFISGIGDNASSVIYFYSLSDTNYVPNGTQINFGNNNANLSDERVTNLTSTLSNEIKALNTYSISELFNLTTEPTFIGANSFKISSSNSNVVSVEFDENNNIKFVAKGTGSATITISSAYNTTLQKSIKVNVVNATQRLDLTYFSQGNKKSVEYGSVINISKSSNENPITLPINSMLDATYNFVSGSTINKEFELEQNANSGVRYYYLSTKTKDYKPYHSIYHTQRIEATADNNNPFNITINNQTFTEEFKDGEYVYYIDVPYGNSADFVGLEESTASLFAVPYIVSNNEKVLLLNQGGKDSEIVLNKAYSITQQSGGQDVVTSNIKIIGGFEIPDLSANVDVVTESDYINLISKLISKFDVKVTKSSWKITQSTNSVTFPVNGTPTFNIEIETDKDSEELFVVYSNEFGTEKIISVSNIINLYKSEIQIGNLTLLVNNPTKQEINNKNYVTYNFGLIVKDENKLNVNAEFTRTFKFFTVKENAPEINYDDFGFVTNSVTSIADLNMMATLPVTLIPQDIVDIKLKHYPNSETTTKTDSNGNKITEVNLSEIAYDNLIPGNVGILKVYISPYFAYFDDLEIVSTGSGNDIVLFEQMLANIEETESGVLYTGKYETLIVSNNQITSGIKLVKNSYKTQDGVTGYDGNIYIRTLVNSFVTEANSFTLTLRAYKNGEVVKTASITLDVQTPPSLQLSINGDKEAPIARGTEQSFTATLNGVEGSIDFSESYIYRINTNGMEVRLGGIGSDFNIKQSNGNYSITTNVNLPTSRYIKIVGTVTKQINGETITHTDSLTLKVTDFVINEISVDKVENGSFVGMFNQPYSLIVRISKATYNPSISTLVKEKITQLEKEFSSYYEGEIEVWRSVNKAYDQSDERRYGTLSLGYNSSKTFIIGSKSEEEFNNALVYSVQNTKFDSGDTLAALVNYIYTDNGIVALVGENKEKYENVTAYKYEKTFEFGFGFYRVRDEEKPDPIENVTDFMKMEDGVDYILVNDLVLTDWVPFRDDLKINSLDGNGYVITIESFALDTYVDGQELIPNKNIGLFGKINSGTTIKNLIIEIVPKNWANSIETASESNTNADLVVDARAYENINFGILAGENEGIITNVQVVEDAGELKLERELTFASAYPNDPLYSGYYNVVNGVLEFDKNQFILDNFSRFYPNKDYVKDDQQQPVLDLNGDLQIIAKENTTRRDLSVVRIETTTTVDVQTHYMAGLVGVNLDSGTDALGYITNSSVENITINGVGYVAGFVANNSGKISTSYFKGANVINRVAENYAEAATGGFVVFNSGTNAAIQYSYVQGRLGEGTNFSNPNNGTSNYPYADKTGLNADAKKDFAGYNYINNGVNLEGYKTSVATLRAMNSIISSKTRASGFVYENDSIVSNSYSNIMVNSSMQTSGFVYNNKEHGTISSCYSLSSVKVNSMASSPFVGRSSNYEYNNANPEGIEDCHYLKIGSDENAVTAEITYAEEFLDENEPATSLGASQFGEYNTFQGYAFNTDFELSSEESITRSVWFIPNAASQTLYKSHFKDTYYVSSRPELVAANLKTTSIRVWTGTDESEENSYNYISDPIGESVHNPLLIKSAENFNNYLNYDATVDAKDRNFAIRFISDIAFNKTDLTAQTYNMDYYGDLDGNGMTINELRLVSDTDFENPETGKTITHLGLFGRIITQPLDEENSQRGVVRNLNINVSEVRGSKVTYVGALAGSIENANVFNVNITGNEVIQGKNIVGGLAGIISGDSEIVNITSNVSAKSAYFKNSNIFSANYSNQLPSVYGTFDIYNKEVIGDLTNNAETVSYVGGIAGIFDVDERDEDENINPLSLFNSKARKLTIQGSVSLIGEIVGGIFGLNGDESTASDLTFIVEKGATPELIGSRITGGLVGENRGEIDRSYIEHSSTLQKQIDESYKTAVSTSATNPTVNNSNLNYNNLFKGNAHYIGGVIGFNNGGVVKNSYSKINVINLDSMYAGGFVGLSIGGQYNFCYTTGSVSGFKASGGFVGLQTVNPFMEASNVTEFKNDIFGSYIYIEPTKSNMSNIDGRTTSFVGVVASNIWRSEDLETDRILTYNANNNLSIGAMIGVVVTGETGNALTLSNTLSSSGLLNERRKGETNFFVQPKITVSNLLVPTKEQLHMSDADYNEFKKLYEVMPEIGAFNSNFLYTTNQRYIVDDVRFSNTTNSTGDTFESATTLMYKPTGLSGYVEEAKKNNQGQYIKEDGSTTTNPDEAAKVYYQYSRLQNIGSSRTLKEIITTLDVISTEAVSMGDKFVNNQTVASSSDIYRSPVFDTWNVNRWTGVRKETAADQNTVFPYLEAKPEKTRIEVRTYEDLKLMSTYTNAEFILMNDIDLAENKDEQQRVIPWEAVGTRAIPFKGSLHSNGDNQYTIYNLTINNALSTYVGLVGYASEAEFKNFNLSNVNIDIDETEQGALFIGSLVGYATMSTKIENVNIVTGYINATNSNITNGATITTSGAGTVGGLVGFSALGTIKDCGTYDLQFKNGVVSKDLSDRNDKVLININKIGDISKLENDVNKTLAFGGLVGMMTSLTVEEPMITNSVVDASLTFNNSTSIIPTDDKLGSDLNRSFDIGGLIGRSNDETSSQARITNVNINAKINADLNFGTQTKIAEINIGNAIGKSVATLLTEDISVDNKYSRNYIYGRSEANTVNVNGFDGMVNYGGAIGYVVGSTLNQETTSVVYTSYEISQTLIGNNQELKANINVKNTNKINNNVANTNANNINVGGAVGYANNANVVNVNANTNLNVVLSGTESVLKAGGLIGKISNGQLISNLISLGTLTIDDCTTSVSNNNEVNAGGAFGEVVMAQTLNGFGQIKKVISQTNVIVKPTSTLTFNEPLYVGGFAGVVYSGSIGQSVSTGNVSVKKNAMNGTASVGGFIGKIDISSQILNGTISNKVEITNNIATTDLELTSMFEDDVDSQKAGLFVGSISYNNNNSSLTLRSNYTIGKYIYNSEMNSNNVYYDALYNERVNKGGFLGGFDIVASNVTLSNIETVSNLTFNNNYYNKEFVPFSNDYMNGLTVNEMLYNCGDSNGIFTDKTTLGFNSDQVWYCVNNKYPILTWIQTSTNAIGTDGTVDTLNLENSVAGNSVLYVVGSGTKLSPSTNYALDEDNASYIITNTNVTSSFSGVNQTIYYQNQNAITNTSFEINNLDRYSLVYGLFITANKTSAIVNNNYGIIVNSSIKNGLVNNNYGVVYEVTFNGLNGFNGTNNLKYVANNNNGAIDSVVANLAFSGLSSSNKAYIANANNGAIYRTVIKNTNNLFEFAKTNSGKIKTSYIITTENVTEGSTSGTLTKGTYYDGLGTSSVYELNNTVNTDVKFNTSEVQSDLTNINGFNFVDDWILISSSNSNLNYGAPMLRYELKETNGAKGGFNFNSEIISGDNGYYWAKALNQNEFNTLVNNYKNKSIIEINSNEDFANVASANSYGYQENLVVDYASFNNAKFNENIMTSVSNEDGTLSITKTEFKYGIVKTTTLKIINFEGKTIKLNKNIDLSGKLWTPIGNGFDNLKTAINEGFEIGNKINAMFKGSIEGAGFSISGVTVIEENKNAGLFGTVYATNQNTFANNVLIKDSNFISVSKNGGFALSGALAGRVVLTTSANLIMKVGTENANVFATNRASGIVGDILNASGLNANDKVEFKLPTMQYAYVNSYVIVSNGDDNIASAIINFGNNASVNASNQLTSSETNGLISEMYFAGNIGDFRLTNLGEFKRIDQHSTSADLNACQSTDSVETLHRFFGNSPLNSNGTDFNNNETARKSMYAINFLDTTSMSINNKIDENFLINEAIPNFTWGAAWTRMFGQNNNYPVLNAKVSYWVSRSNDDGMVISGSTYSINKPEQLAWIAEQVNTGVKTFQNETIVLTADINLKDYIWSPIGYNSSNSFRGTFDFNGHKITNIITSGTYIKDSNSVIGVSCVDSKNIGLFGYTSNAKIISSTGVGTIGDDLDNSKIVGRGSVGGVVGFAENTEIENIVNNAYIASTLLSNDGSQTGVGGIVGTAYLTISRDFDNLTNNGNISVSRNNAGGIVGLVYGSNVSLNITKSINTGNITSTSDNVGGIVGATLGNSISSTITEYVNVSINGIENWTTDYTGDDIVRVNTTSKPDNSGNIKGKENVGGIVGKLSSGSIEAVTNIGEVVGLGNSVGGIAGYVDQGGKIYEAINTGNIGGTGNVGGIAGNINLNSTTNSTYLVNLLNKGKIQKYSNGVLENIDSSTFGKFVGYGSDLNKLLTQTYSAIDVSSNASSSFLFGNNNTLNHYFHQGVMNLASINTVLNTNTKITYDGSEYVKFDSVFADSLVWQNVKDANAETIKLAYNTLPQGSAPTLSGSNYEVSNADHFKYLTDLNRKRFGVSSVTGGINIISNITLSDISPMGMGAYPWRNDVNGGNHTLTINSVSADAVDYSLFGSIFGESSKNVNLQRINLKYNVSTINKETGLLINIGNYVNISNVVLSSNNTITVSNKFGTIANTLTNSVVSNSSNSINIKANITQDGVGGLVADIKDTNIISSNNTGDINGNIYASSVYVGGIVGNTYSTNGNNYINGCKNISDISFTNQSTSKTYVGGITGNDYNYSYNSDFNGEIHYKSNNVLDERVGSVKGNSYVGGIIGNANQTKIVKNVVNNGVLEGSYVGGIIGNATSVIVEDTTNTNAFAATNNGLINTGKRSGGIIGNASSTTINKVTNDTLGEVMSTNGYSGGIVGYANKTTIKNSYNNGYVASRNFDTSGTGAITGTAINNSRIESNTIRGYVGLYARTRNGVNYYYRNYNTDNTNGSGVTFYGDYHKSGGKVVYKSGDVYKDTNLSSNKKYNYSRVSGTQNSSTLLSNTFPDLTTLSVYDYYVNVTTENPNFAGWGHFTVKLTAYKAEAHIDSDSGGFRFTNYSQVGSSENSAYYGWFYGWGAQASWAKTSVSFDTVSSSYIEANGDTPQYTVTFDPQNGQGVKTETYYQGDPLKLPTYSKEGAVFVGWFDKNGEQYLENHIVESNLNLTARWEDSSYVIGLYDNEISGSDYKSLGTITVKHNKPIDFSDPKLSPTKNGYKFQAWYLMSTTIWNETVNGAIDGETNAQKTLEQYIDDWEDAKLVTDPNNVKGTGFENTKVTSSTTFEREANIYALFVAIRTVTFNYNYEGAPKAKVVEVAINTPVQKPSDPSRDGYELVDWYLNAEGTGSPYNFSNPVTNNITLYAKWKGITRHVIINYNDPNGNLENVELLIENGNSVEDEGKTPQDPEIEGYTFVEWQYNGETFDFATPITSDMEITAIWERNEYTVNFYALAGEDPIYTQTILHGDSLKAETILDPSRAGYTFEGWKISTDGGQSLTEDFDINLPITDSYEVYAYWVPIPQNVSFVYDVGEGEQIIDTLQVNYDSKVTAPETNPILEGYRFNGWYTSSNYSTRFDFENTIIQDETKIYAQFIKQITITFVLDDSQNHGNIHKEIPVVIDINTVISSEQIPDTSELNHNGLRLVWKLYNGDVIGEEIDLTTYTFTEDTKIITTFTA